MEANLRTVNDIFFLAIERELPCIVSYKTGRRWKQISCTECYRSVAGVAAALDAWGLKPGDRAAVLSENRPEWAIADFACLGAGIVDVPIYPTLTAEQAAYILRDSGARVAFVSTAEQLRKVEAVQHETAIEKIVVMDEISGASALAMQPLMRSGPEAHSAQFDERARDIQ